MRQVRGGRGEATLTSLVSTPPGKELGLPRTSSRFPGWRWARLPSRGMP